jgi:hypothetical protein
MYYSNDNIDSISEINIKILNDKYEINLNKIIRNTHFVTTYEGINNEHNENNENNEHNDNNSKIIIDKYVNNILNLCKKISTNIITISHLNIIEIVDIIIEKNTAYIIKPYYQNINVPIKSQSDYITYCKQILSAINYLCSKNINIETLFIDNIFLDNNNIIISPYFCEDRTKQKNILYGSPLYSPPELFNKYMPEKESVIVWNLGIIFYQLLFNKNPFENCKEYDDILENKINNKEYDKYIDIIDIIDIIFKMIETNKLKRISLNNVIVFFDNYDNNKNDKKNNQNNKNNNFDDFDDNIFVIDLKE